MIQTTSVPLAYQGVERVQVLCLLQQDGALAGAADRARLCSAVARFAGTGTELPVSVIELGDPGVVAPGRLTILVHGAIVDSGEGRSVALTMRPYRADVSGADVLFGAMPRMAELADDGALAAAIAASLDEILPWRQTAPGVRRID